jgi:glycosyltransferase involved in cell wall biosynthesis
MRSISIIIPVYNSELSLRPLVARLEGALDILAERYEVIFVNDGSRDSSWQVVSELTRAHDWVRGINLMRNYGQHNALLAGTLQASGDLIVTMDDDLQHRPEDIVKLIEAMDQLGADVVYGAPIVEQHGVWRDLASVITKLVLQSVMGVEAARHTSAFRLFKRELTKAFRHYNGSFVDLDALLTWGTSRFAAIKVPHEPRSFGVSNYTFRKLVAHALDMMTCFSILPLQLASIVGFVFTFVGFGLLGFVLLRYFIQGSSVPGFVFLASAVTLLSGAQLFASGVIGEYLARIHFRIMGKPATVTRQRIGFKKEK